MLTEDDMANDMTRAMCAAVWLIFFLIMKNLVLLVMLAIQRRKNAIYRIPEDAIAFGVGQPTSNADDWTLAGRIQRVLANDVEYIPYFLALLIIMFCTVPLRSSSYHHYLARVLSYGLLFTIGRYLHTIGYLVRLTYGRILGFLISVSMLFVMLIDHIYYVTKGLPN